MRIANGRAMCVISVSQFVVKLSEPLICHHLKFLDNVETLESIFCELERAPEEVKVGLYFGHCFVFRGIGEMKLL